MNGRFEAVFFDLDGTLVHDGAGDAVRRTAHELARRHGLDADAILVANAEVWSGCWAEQGERWMRGELPGDALPREIWRLTLAAVGQDDAALLDEAAQLHVRAEHGTFALFAETLAVLESLRSDGILLGIITNGPSEFQRAKLATVGIDGLFDVVVASGDIGVLKPAGEIFELAAARLGVAAGRALHIGDNFAADVVGAADAGMTAVWINRDAAVAPRSDVVHRDIRSLRDVLAEEQQETGIPRR
ncbi:MAG TPA: HAD-IA family hydrolase [Microbacterium sp.]|nr:HAD-IA family hydrolase [Microbacterium sp.]